MKSIKDLIYFDYEKARSLISQIQGGLISEISRAFEDEGEHGAELGFDLKVVKGKVGGKNSEKHIKTEKIEVYHEILNQIEAELRNKKLLTDINNEFEDSNDSFEDFVKTTHTFSFIKANGWSQFEDIGRLKKIISNFNEVQRFIYSSSLLENPEFQNLQRQIKDARKGVEHLDRNQKARELSRLKELEKQFDDKLKKQSDIHLFDDDYINRMKMFLDTFSPNRLNFRLLPLDVYSDFQILANLKERYLIDSDFESIIYTYGTRPNIKLSVLGIVTSSPQQTDPRVDPNDEYLGFDDEELNEVENFDKALRSLFDSFEVFEEFFFAPSFPKLAISPIAIYREVKYED